MHEKLADILSQMADFHVTKTDLNNIDASATRCGLERSWYGA